jgi:hypothetical protein
MTDSPKVRQRQELALRRSATRSNQGEIMAFPNINMDHIHVGPHRIFADSFE